MSGTHDLPATRQQCIDAQDPPELSRGDTVDTGRFFRNVRRDHVVKRYSEDDNDQPQYGFKIKRRHWQHANRPPGAMSVNLVTCMHSEKCSLSLQPGGENYYHVAILDLGAINSAQVLSFVLVAQYKPVDDIPNHCHFEVVPKDGVVMKWMEFSAVLDEPFPDCGKLPGNEQERQEATKAAEQYRSFVDIKRWVRNRNGTLV